MKVTIEILNLNKVKKERNSKIIKALEHAVNELRQPKYISIIYIYIDGDPVHKRYINLN